MYNVPLPISALRMRLRQEFEKNRFVSKLPVVDVLLFKSHSEYQVRSPRRAVAGGEERLAHLCSRRLTATGTGDDELLETDNAYHGLL